MSTFTEPEIILYDLATTKNECFSPSVWFIRLMLNYKRIPYRTIFLDFPDIEPRMKELGVVPPQPISGGESRYTVPTIQNLSTDKHIMDSEAIAPYLESTYPDPPLPLHSEFGDEVQAKAEAVAGKVTYTSLLAREVHILSPRSQEYFLNKVEAGLGHPPEDLIKDGKEEKGWADMDADLRNVSELLLRNKADGPFVMGAKPSYVDFVVAGRMQTTRMIDEGTWERMMQYPGYARIYEACLPFIMQKKN